MEKAYFCVHYKTRPLCSIKFTVDREYAAFVELLDGSAHIQQDGEVINLPRRERYRLQPLNVLLNSNDGCSFKVCGRHEITWSEERGKQGFPAGMFKLLQIDSRIELHFAKKFQLLVFHREDTRRVTLDNISGSPRVLGCAYPTQSNDYYLPPYTPVLLKNDKIVRTPYCAVTINEPTELFDFFISPYDTKLWTDVINVQRNMVIRRCVSMTTQFAGPKILVLGKRTVTKMSVCHYILDKSLENCNIPIYADLNVRENSAGIPGSVRIVSIRNRRFVNDGRCHVSNLFSPLDEHIFSFGYVNPRGHLKLYYQLIKSLGDISNDLNWRYTLKSAGTVIDMCDSLTNNVTAITRVVRAFHANMLLVVGDQNLYNILRSFNLRTLQMFIPDQEDFEPLNYNLHNCTLRDYFLQNRNIFPIKFSDIEICEIRPEGAAGIIQSNTVIPPEDVRAVRIACGKHLETCVLGVSECSTIDQRLPVTPVKYFVFIMTVDMENETLSMLSPKADSLIGAILLKGDIKCQIQNEA